MNSVVLCIRFVLGVSSMPALTAGVAALWAAPAAAQAATVRTFPNIAYKSGASADVYETERCRLDLYLPGGAGAQVEGAAKSGVSNGFPVLVWFHGGGLTAGVKNDPATVAIALQFAASGIAVAAVNYRLSPQAHYPAYTEDAAAAFAWVKAHIAEHGGDPSRVFIGGHSAGGYLALMAGLDQTLLGKHGLNLKSVAGIIPVAGQTLTHYTIREERGLPKNVPLADAAAPVNHVTAEAAPLLILYAEKDMAMRAEENQLLAAALRASGHREVTVLMVPGSDHGSVGNDLGRAGNPGFAAVRDFILRARP